MEARFIYRDQSAARVRGAPDKVIVYVNGVLCAMDREARITIPVSRWKLAEIGLACFWAAVKGEGRATHSLEPVSPPEPTPDALPAEVFFEPVPEISQQESLESGWEHLMREMRDLSR
jgi:hypothetical protein